MCIHILYTAGLKSILTENNKQKWTIFKRTLFSRYFEKENTFIRKFGSSHILFTGRRPFHLNINLLFVSSEYSGGLQLNSKYVFSFSAF